MTITTKVVHVTDESTESVTLSVADKTNLILVSSDLDQKTGNATAVYTLSGADAGYPVNLTVNIEPVVPGKSRRGSFTFRTWVKQTSDVSDVVTRWPIQASITFLIGGDAPLALADFNKLIGVLTSYTYLSVAAGVRDTTWLAKILAGSPQVK
jgi:hypothetical protein